MNSFVFHPEAVLDLNEIWEYIAADNVAAADRVIAEIREAIQGLANFPEMGHRRPDLTSKTIRFHTVRSFLVAYMPDEKPLVVLALLHGRRNPRVIGAILCDRD